MGVEEQLRSTNNGSKGTAREELAVPKSSFRATPFPGARLGVEPAPGPRTSSAADTSRIS